MPSALDEKKSLLRGKMRKKVSAFGVDVLDAAERRITEKLCAHFIYRRAETVMMYMAISNEVSLGTLSRKAIKDGKTVVFPRVEGSNLAPYAVRDVKKEMVKSKWGVLEPKATQKKISVNQLDLVLIPGLAFDRLGWRLGRGKGFYDRFLAGLPDMAHTIGICHDVQLVNAVPYGANDTCLDEVIAV